MKYYLAVIFTLVMASPAWALTARLSWTDNSTNEDGFKIYRAVDASGPMVEIGQVGADVVAFDDPGAAPSSCYQLTAFNSVSESVPSNKACLPGPVNGVPGSVVVIVVVAP